MHTRTAILDGQEYVMVRRVDWDRLRIGGDKKEYTLDDVRRSLAAKMVRRRQAAGLTQSELARRAKVRVETISRLENAQHMPSVRTFDRINHVLHVR
jgi:ribosome-binding protein aMBF1 (putative translation factor)